ncbi:Sugar transferase involved in LPS biosynthesis (colanic, teichoic acid) [Jannaschia pohangensis]|uniref:Sugar transferase involved in LPS biosynthesis (Colanic, teichoic acid) n=2 Tax=Jannaschia pohangensis TaxID=390807 RepID=A0A1I3U9N7_9RHOB|nr:sugar transferase [Jannaschia pohangensis]SFJ79433.1 Sugar transferase involved in LPS biosynthesis (colanic, teichoic acid) [Jannaschia pohangensis]
MTPGKRLFDILFSLYLMVFLAPVFAVVTWKVWRQQGGPIFYGSERMKSPTEAFTLWKYRTMADDPSDTGVTGGDKASRITPLGAALRRRRLDELPQLWNILKGDVSFVGPRPPLRRYVEMFPDLYGEVLKSRPGVTGLASLIYSPHEERILSACNTAAETEAEYIRVCVPRKAALDLLYQRNRTFWMDVKLISWTTAKFLPRAIRPKRKGKWV